MEAKVRMPHPIKEYHVSYVEKPEESAWGIIGRAISQYNREHAGEEGFQRLCFVLQADDEEEIAGGVIAELYWGWLHIDLLWVKEELRGHGHGHRLLTAVEEEARRRGARHAYLDTFSFQAPDFYQGHGYRLFGELEDFPPGQQRHFFVKSL